MPSGVGLSTQESCSNIDPSPIDPSVKGTMVAVIDVGIAVLFTRYFESHKPPAMWYIKMLRSSGSSKMNSMGSGSFPGPARAAQRSSKASSVGAKT